MVLLIVYFIFITLCSDGVTCAWFLLLSGYGDETLVTYDVMLGRLRTWQHGGASQIIKDVSFNNQCVR